MPCAGAQARGHAHHDHIREDVHGDIEARQRLVYVVPQDWTLLPAAARPEANGIPLRKDAFDRTRYKLLFARARSHDPEAAGQEIVKDAYGLDPIIFVHVDIAARKVTAIEQPPAHVRWADIPIPMF